MRVASSRTAADPRLRELLAILEESREDDDDLRRAAAVEIELALHPDRPWGLAAVRS